MSIKSKLFKLAMPLALIGMASCSQKELEPNSGYEREVQRTIEVDLQLEATASMDLKDQDEARSTGGAVQLHFLNRQPLIKVLDTKPGTTTDSIQVRAHCVFKPLKAGSTTELDDTRALYGDVYFKHVKDSEPSIEGTKAVAVKLISDGKVTLKGNTSMKAGEQWYVSGIVGGTADETGRNIAVNGLTVAIENNGTLSGLDMSSKSLPFLSKWVKLAPIKTENVALSNTPMHFKFQGVLFSVDVKNGTRYNLQFDWLYMQSTELTGHVSYDLASSHKITDAEEDIAWRNTAQVDLEGRWYTTAMGFYAEDRFKYLLDAKTSDDDEKYLYDANEPNKHKATVVFWAHALKKEDRPQRADRSLLPPRTGFFVTVQNTEANPKGNTTGNSLLKYVYSNDKNVDDILGNIQSSAGVKPAATGFSADIQMAPSMQFVCARAIQRSLHPQRGNFVSMTITVPERPVMPIETMAQRNVYDHKSGAKAMQFAPLDAKGVLNANKGHYVQEASYAYQLADQTNSYWMLPTAEQFYGVLLPGNNIDKTHNWNPGDAGSGIYNWVEKGADVKEKIVFSDGSSGEYYMMYGRPEKGKNDHKIYGLRYFTDENYLKGSNHFSLTKYEITTNGVFDIMRVQTAWLGPEYAKLYEGVYPDQRAWIKEIAQNDGDNSDASLFKKLEEDFVTRDLVISPGHEIATYRFNAPTGYDRDIIGYFYGPKSSLVSASRARGLAFKNRRLFTGYSDGQGMKVDFTDFYATGISKAYLRTMRRNFTKFVYR